MSTFNQPENYIDKYAILRRAREIYLWGKVRCPFTALRAAYHEYSLKRKLMIQQLAHVTFRKADGSIRHAIVTHSSDLIPEKQKPKGTGSGYTSLQIRFYDVAINEWRSCRVERIISIDW